MSSSSGRRRFLLRRPAVVDLGCGCRRTKLASLFSFSTLRRSKPKPAHEPGSYTSASPRHHHRQHHPLSSYYPFSTPSAATSAASSWETSRHTSSVSTTTTSPYDDLPIPAATSTTSAASSKGRVGESVAVVKESEDPYWDFRQSMLQMILEKEIYSWEDLQELLSSFLALNSPCHHDVILRAFTEIWGGVYPPNGAAAAAASSSYGEHGRPCGGHGGSGAGPRRRRRPSLERVAL